MHGARGFNIYKDVEIFSYNNPSTLHCRELERLKYIYETNRSFTYKNSSRPISKNKIFEIIQLNIFNNLI